VALVCGFRDLGVGFRDSGIGSREWCLGLRLLSCKGMYIYICIVCGFRHSCSGCRV